MNTDAAPPSMAAQTSVTPVIKKEPLPTELLSNLPPPPPPLTSTAQDPNIIQPPAQPQSIPAAAQPAPPQLPAPPPQTPAPQHIQFITPQQIHQQMLRQVI